MSYNTSMNLYEGYIYVIWNDNNEKVYIGQTITSLSERWHGHMSTALNEKVGTSVLYKAMRKYGRNTFHIELLEKIIANSENALLNKLNNLEVKYIKAYHSWVLDPLGPGYNTEPGGKNKSVSGRIVCKYDNDLNLLDEYKSLRDAARLNNIDDTTIWAVCNHDYYTAGGFIWAYKNDSPIKPDYTNGIERTRIASKKYWNEWHKYNNVKAHKKPKSRALPEAVKHNNRLQRLCCNNERIFVYNAYGDVIKIYNDIVDAIENIPISAQEIKKNLCGENLCYNKMVIRYEGDSFDKYPMSRLLQPITLYDLSGNFVNNFESVSDAEHFCKCTKGEIRKAIKRGGSCNGYIPVFYGTPFNKIVEPCDVKVAMKNSENKIIKIFPNKKSIARYFHLEDCHHGLNKAIENKTLYRGYYWDELK